MTEISAWKFVEQTEKLIEQHNRDHFEIGMRLVAIRDEKLYVGAGFDTFDLYLQSIRSKYDYERRTLYNFIKLHSYFVQNCTLSRRNLPKLLILGFWRSRDTLRTNLTQR